MPGTKSFISIGQDNILKSLVFWEKGRLYQDSCKAAVQNCGRGIFRFSCWLLWILVVCYLWEHANGMRPLKRNSPSIENTSWLDQNVFSDRSGLAIGPYSMLNISGTYKGTWIMHNPVSNSSTKLPDFHMTYGNILFELLSSPTEIHGVHYVQGLAVLGEGLSSNSADIERMQLKMEGVYVWPFRQLRMVLSNPLDGEANKPEEFFPLNPYHLLGIFSLQVLQESPREHLQRNGRSSPILEMSRNCKIQMAAQVFHALTDFRNGDQEHQPYEMKGLIESPKIENEGECFSALTLNATSVNVDVYYNKAVNYTLMVTFVLFLIRQMDHSSTQSGAAKVSLWMIGQQAIMDAYLCLLHLTAGILVESLFNAFATAAFFKFVIFSIFEMRYLLAIWKARRPATSGEGWEAMRRELSVLYSRFYGFLLGGILLMYELHNLLHYILFLLYSFWIPQIVSNVKRDSRKPLHVHYIVGITATRLAIPLYIFGCPKNFLRLKTDIVWCTCLVAFLVLQALVLLLQHYLGARWFIPRQLLPEKYSYFRRVDRGTLQVILGDSNAAADCVICMATVDIGQRSTDCMVTPCDHFFHAGCLQRWMDIKMECPTCRRPLPPM
ncbi:hypothetical protein O6H91_02G063600 [Diphasiastrum complanatum]|uniref:Uncharacterized protein n=1 Tax=Diphasiastrum complanatum TaxID=34168 RepID=A0ACC2EGA7_DIPCM|nr:hypothetical protein O6H91_02G063600 [Diphasiastrum complanatum]